MGPEVALEKLKPQFCQTSYLLPRWRTTIIDVHQTVIVGSPKEMDCRPDARKLTRGHEANLTGKMENHQKSRGKWKE